MANLLNKRTLISSALTMFVVAPTGVAVGSLGSGGGASGSSSSYCKNQTAICSPYSATLTNISCTTQTVPGQCCIKKTYQYTCTKNGTVHTVVHAYIYSGTRCKFTTNPVTVSCVSATPTGTHTATVD